MIHKYAEIFCWKNVSSFCTAKATHIFSAKNFRIMYIESPKTVNEMTLNELVKLTMLWTTGPWSSTPEPIRENPLLTAISPLNNWALIIVFSVCLKKQKQNKTFLTLQRSHFFYVIVMNIIQNVCLDNFWVKLEICVTWRQKVGH